MFYTYFRCLGITAGMATLLLTASAVRAEDFALCIGVNTYNGLRSGSNLEGCVTDANLFAKTVQKFGFRTVVLTEERATKQGVLNAIRSARVGGTDRFIVYFASHGTVSSNGETVLLPSDAQDNNETNDIQVKELFDAVSSVQAKTKTVVLDSCHSGGMVRGVRGLKGWNNRRPRFYVRSKVLNKPATRSTARDLKAWVEEEANGADVIKPVTSDTTICYYTAALKTQVANELNLGGEAHGVFTYYLCQSLLQGGMLWRDLSTTVAAQVANATDNEQQPLLHPTVFLGQVVFGEGAVPPPKPPQPKPIGGLDELYALSSPDPGMLSLKRYPEYSPVPVGSANYFEVTVGTDGYLVVLNRDPKNDMFVVWPKVATVDAMRVTAGQTVRIPSGSRIVRPDTEGTDGMKAILFPNNAAGSNAGMAMLRAFQRDGALVPLTSREARQRLGKSREWKEDETYYTSEVITQIVK